MMRIIEFILLPAVVILEVIDLCLLDGEYTYVVLSAASSVLPL